MFCGARFFNQPLNQLPRLRATPGGSGAVTARLALTGTLITGNLPIITPRRGSGVNNPVNNPTGFRLNPFIAIMVIEFCNFVSLLLIKIFAAFCHRAEQAKVIDNINDYLRRDVRT